MPKLFVACLVLAVIMIPCLAMASNSETGWSVGVDNKIGASTYIEEETPVKSNSTAFYYEGILIVDYFREKGIVGRLDFGMPITAVEQETWDVNGIQYQTNDLSYWGLESNIELGYAFPVIKEKLSIAPLGAYGFSFTRFTRTNFNVLNIITSNAVVDEDFWVQHIDLGGRLCYYVNEDLDIDMKGLFGFVVYNSAENSVAGSITGEGGYLVKTEVNVNYDLIKSLYISGGIFFDMQHLNGATKDNLMWPDNYLYTYGAKIKLKYAF